MNALAMALIIAAIVYWLWLMVHMLGCKIREDRERFRQWLERRQAAEKGWGGDSHKNYVHNEP